MPAFETEDVVRCSWTEDGCPETVRYHDEEFGRMHSDRELWEQMVLQIFQSGLSWDTVMRRRDAFRCFFPDPLTVAGYEDEDLDRILLSGTIIANRRKVRAVCGNAPAFMKAVQQAGSFLDWMKRSGNSEEMLARMKDLGFRWIGPRHSEILRMAAGLQPAHDVQCFLNKKEPDPEISEEIIPV